MRVPLLRGGPPPRLLVTVAAVAAVVVIVLIARPGLPRDRPARTVAPSTVATSAPADEGSVYTPSSVRPVDVAAARRTAVGFATAWARPDLAAGPWWQGVAVYAEPGYARLLRSVDPANVPANRVTGAARVVSEDSGLVVVDVPTDAGTCRVTVADSAGTGTWRVSTHSWIPGGPR
jgi:hypothetical protein